MADENKAILLRKIDSVLAKIIKMICIIMLATIVLITAISVFSRFVFFFPLNFANPLSIYLMVWISFLGSGLAIRRGEHIFVELFINRFEEKVRLKLLFIINFIISLFLISMIYYGFQFAIAGLNSHDEFVFNINMTLPYLSVPIGMLYMEIVIILKTTIQLLEQKDINLASEDK